MTQIPHNTTNVPVTPPVSLADIPVLAYADSFFLKEYVDGTTTVTFGPEDDFSKLVNDPVAIESAIESAERTMLDGSKQRGQRTVTFENVTAPLEVALGTPKFARLADRTQDDAAAPNRGAPMVFFRGYRDGRARKGVCYVERMNPLTGTDVEAFAYNTELSFASVEWFDARSSLITISAVSPASAAQGATVSHTGTGLTNVTAVRLKTGSTVVATVTTFSTKTGTSLAYAVPTGLTVGTAYGVFAVAGGQETAAGTLTRAS